MEFFDLGLAFSVILSAGHKRARACLSNERNHTARDQHSVAIDRKLRREYPK